MRWSDVWILYRRELRSALRERAIVVNSILIPILLYPLLFWLMISGFTFVEGLSERSVSRITLVGLPERHAALGDTLGGLHGVELLSGFATAGEAAAAVREGRLDAAVAFVPPAEAGAALPDNFRVRITYDRSEDRSRRAKERVEAAIDRYRARWLAREAAALGVARGEFEQYRVERENVATGDEMGARFLGQIIPMLLVIMVGLGCFIPAIDSTAGERERATWETMMTVAAPRSAVLVAKYLYVATLGIVAGALNVIAMTASLGMILARMLADRPEALQFRIPLEGVPVLLLGAAGLALFFAAAMMILGSFARTFKDGQSMVTPVYYLALLPIFLGESADQRLTPEIAMIPIVNLTQMMRDALRGSISLPLVAETMAVQLALVALCLWVARQILRFEDHMVGTYDGSFWRFARERLLPGRGRPARTGGRA